MSRTDMAPDGERAFLLGQYEMCALLLSSPRFSRPQREVIEEQAYRVKERLEVLGVEFQT